VNTQEDSSANDAGSEGRMAERLSCRDMMDFDTVDQEKEAQVEGE
jgi:hypothetical protein